jgi:phenylpropionate dioxygenase-like ring-hydroxylating dioxygenase large terminal subunit
MMKLDSFWYVVAMREELREGVVLPRKVLGESLAVFRGDDGRAVALRDRCMHRNAPLSKGTVSKGCLTCPYHGWTYDKEGTVVAVPAEGDKFRALASRAARRFDVVEQDDFVYVRLASDGPADVRPFAMPHYGEPGWETVRLVNTFDNDVTNCAENFIDIPHTAFVHLGTFRSSRKQKIDATIRRVAGAVHIEYRNETDNLGLFARFLNPRGARIEHRDNFFMPNVTSVEYVFNPYMRLYITSQSVPEADDRTRVYTDVTYDYGLLNKVARPFIRWHAQQIIDQDLDALADQMEVIRRYGREFNNTKADAIHVLVESIRDELAAGRDPRALPEKNAEVSFWV